MPRASSSAASVGGAAASSHSPIPDSGTGTAVASSRGTKASPIAASPRTSACPGSYRALHHAVTRVCPRIVLSPETAKSTATAAVPDSPSPPSRRTSKGSAR